MSFIITLVTYFKMTLVMLSKKHLLVSDLIIRNTIFLLTNGTYLFFSGQFENIFFIYLSMFNDL